jgi:hypothetical protein
MQAFAQPRLVEFASTAIRTKALQVTPQQASDAKAFGKRFLTMLMSCLSAWGT